MGPRIMRSGRQGEVGESPVVPLVLAASLTHCSAATPLVEGQGVVVEGRVSDIDATAMVRDGDGLISLKSDVHGAVTIHIPARERLCQAQGLALFQALRAGDRIRATGTVTGTRDVMVCVKTTHSLQKIE